MSSNITLEDKAGIRTPKSAGREGVATLNNCKYIYKPSVDIPPPSQPPFNTKHHGIRTTSKSNNHKATDKRPFAN